MKKIFAIALAVVMVLSMASAFALSDCFGNFAWPCDPDRAFCGRGTVEVVPVVLVNNACGGSEFQINECAGVVAGLPIFYAIRLNVAANPDADCNFPTTPADHETGWWDEATLTITADEATLLGIDEYDFSDAANAPANPSTDGIDWDADEAISYYLVADADLFEEDETATAWVKVEDLDDYEAGLDLVVFAATTNPANADTSKVKVCATIESYSSGIGTWVYGDYTVEVTANSLTVVKGTETYTYTYDEDTKVGTVNATADFADEVEKLFNLAGCSLGTCLTESNIEKNFGWNNTVAEGTEVEHCFNWSNKTAAVVDAECVVAIPKTGDASLLAWLF